ncbi:MAG TPA: zf-HC2 domain-containing protein [Acidimicrobiales bacterium]|nr:zf-HC2 domain-containing protein [Acidimicrobiales bacterium]
MTYEDVPCREIVELVTDYLEGALSTEDLLVVERHLAFCLGCAAYFEQMRLTIRAAGALRDDDVPPEVMEPFIEAFRSMRR